MSLAQSFAQQPSQAETPPAHRAGLAAGLAPTLDLPPAELTSTLLDMIEHGSGGAAYYADVMEAIVALAVGAPGGPPAGSADFLARLDAGWLGLA